MVGVNSGKRLLRRQQPRKREGTGLGRGPEREWLNSGLRGEKEKGGEEPG